MSSLKGCKSPNPWREPRHSPLGTQQLATFTLERWRVTGSFYVPSTKGPRSPTRKRKKKVTISLRAERRKKADGKRKGLHRKGCLARFPWEGSSDAGRAGVGIPYECLPQIHCLSAAWLKLLFSIFSLDFLIKKDNNINNSIDSVHGLNEIIYEKLFAQNLTQISPQ